MTAALWHGNDDPPNVGDRIEYITKKGVSWHGYYKGHGFIIRHVNGMEYIDCMSKVSQWRLASSGE